MTAVNLHSLARMTVSSTGTGTITLNNAVSGLLTFDLAGCSTAAAGTVVRYAISDTTQSEIGYGTYTSSSLKLTRGSSTTGLKSTNSNQPINMTSAAQVLITPSALDFPVVMDTSGTAATFAPALTLSAALTYGGVTLSNSVTGTGSMVLSASPTFTGTVTAANATISNVLNYGGVALSSAVTGTGSMVLSSSPTFTGTVTIPTLALTTVGAHTISGAITYGGVALNNAVTGTGNMVLSNAPTFTGTTTIATLALTTVGAHTISGAITYGGVTLSNSVTGTGSMALSASPTFTGTVTIPTLSLTTVGAHTISGAITYGGVTLSNSVTGTGSMALSAAPTFTGTALFADISASNNIKAGTTSGGFQCKQGSTGVYSNVFNIYWTGAIAELWIDTTHVGDFAYTSDYRVKKDVIDLHSTWDAVKALRPVKYTRANFTPPSATKENSEPFVSGDDIERWGFIAHEIQETLTPSVATGVKDQPDAIQSLKLDGIVAALTKALQEAMARIEVLEAASKG